jgi:hypothetical protein
MKRGKLPALKVLVNPLAAPDPFPTGRLSSPAASRNLPTWADQLPDGFHKAGRTDRLDPAHFGAARQRNTVGFARRELDTGY